MHVVRHLPSFVRRPISLAVAEALRAGRALSWTPPRPLSEIQPGPIVVSAFVNDAMGIGRAGRMTIDRFIGAGLEAIPHDLRAIINHFPRGGLSLPGGAGGVWFIHGNAPECDVALNVVNAADWSRRYRIGYWAWETTLAPRHWVRTAQWLHEIWTPSQFSWDGIAAAFTAAGRPELIGKLKVQPHPCPAAGPQPQRAEWGLAPETFAALTSFDGRSSMARKNPLGAIAAWIGAFPTPARGAVLLVKSISSSADPEGAADLQARISGRSDIRLIDRRLSDAEMASLIASVDLVISLHRSEGFGLPIAEAMAYGVPALVTGYAAPLEFVSEATGYIVPATEVAVSDPSGGYRTGSWGEPDLAAATEQLTWIAAHPEDRQSRAGAARAAIQALDRHWDRSAIDGLAWRALVRSA